MTDRSGGIPRTFMCEFIALYKAFPCLWNPKARDFNYRNSKARAFNVLMEKYREVEPGASKETIQQRLSSLRNCRRKELKKVKAAQAQGEIYVPQLWYYNLMSFIDDPEEQENNEETGPWTKLTQKQEILDEGTLDDSYTTADSPCPSHDSNGPSDLENSSKSHKHSHDSNGPSGMGNSSKRPREEDEDEEDLMKLVKERIKSMRTRVSPKPSTASTSPPTSEKYHHLAAHWAEKLATLRGEQRIFAEKLINDTFFEAEFGKLGHGCRIIPFS